MLAFLTERRKELSQSPRPLPLAKALLKHPTLGADDGFVSRAMVGVLMGFNPTIIGAVVNVLTEWRRDGVFTALRATLKQAGGTYRERLQLVKAAMERAALMRPMPQVGWRTVRKPHRLGPDGAGVVAPVLAQTGDIALPGLHYGRAVAGATLRHRGAILRRAAQAREPGEAAAFLRGGRAAEQHRHAAGQDRRAHRS